MAEVAAFLRNDKGIATGKHFHSCSKVSGGIRIQARRTWGPRSSPMRAVQPAAGGGRPVRSPVTGFGRLANILDGRRAIDRPVFKSRPRKLPARARPDAVPDTFGLTRCEGVIALPASHRRRRWRLAAAADRAVPAPRLHGVVASAKTRGTRPGRHS